MTYDTKAKTLKIDQSAIIRDSTELEGLSDCNTTNLPMKANSFFDILEKDDYEETNLKTYQ